MVAPHQPVELLDGHLLHPNPVAEAEVAQFGHQRPLGTLADVELLYLLARLDGLGHGAYSENDIFHRRLVFFAVSGYGVSGAARSDACSMRRCGMSAPGGATRLR